MRTSIISVALLCFISLELARGGQEEMKKCADEFGKNIQSFLTKAMSGGDMSKAKNEVCPHMRKFAKCGLKASYSERPSEAELEKLKKSLASANQNLNSIDCGLDMAKMADEVWNAAGFLHPSSVLAIVLAAFGAVFVSKSL